MSSFLNALQQTNNLTQTQNGANALKTTNSAVLDFFARMGAMRSVSETEIAEEFLKAYKEDALLATKALFYARDVRGGLGERRLFNTAFSALMGYAPQTASANLHLLSEYGRWDDLIRLIDNPVLEQQVVSIIKEQLQKDLNTESPSLLAKWMPSEKAGLSRRKAVKRLERKLEQNDNYWTNSEMRNRLESLKELDELTPSGVKLARKLIKLLDMTPKEYRQTLTALRKKIDLVEQRMSSNEWGTIEYGKLPSKSGLLYRKAFMRHDEERYNTYLESLTKGGKVNSKTLFPYELIAKIIDNDGDFVHSDEEYYDLYNAMWSQMGNFTSEDFGDSLVVLDTSDSMTWENNALALKTALSMGLYFTEHIKGRFSNKLITFSEQPKFIEVRGLGFVDRVKNLYRDARYQMGYSTNIEAVFSLLLNIVVAEKLPQSELPKRIVIISDMEFNKAVGIGDPDRVPYNISRESHERMLNERFSTLFQTIRNSYLDKGYELPKIVFWNVNGTNKQFPVSTNDEGVQLLSGHSKDILKALVEEKASLTAYELMESVLNDPRYDAVKVPF